MIDSPRKKYLNVNWVLNELRTMSRAKEWLWRFIWNQLEGDQNDIIWKGNYALPADVLDPQAIFAFQIEDEESRPFTIFHFIAHMENMRVKLPRQEYDLHRDWVFNTHPNKVPSFKELVLALLNVLVCCCAQLV